MMRPTLAALLLIGCASAPLAAQDSCGLLRVREVSGMRHDVATAATMADSAIAVEPMFRRASAPLDDRTCAAPEWLEGWLESPAPLGFGDVELDVDPVSLAGEYNSAYPRDRLNGALWAGRGLSGAVGLGVSARWRWLSASVRPLLLHQENADFRTYAASVPGHSSLIYPWHNGAIDWPQRFGYESFGGAELGPSYVRADVGAFAIGVSNENLWWGPAQRYPLLMGNNAAGFPHAFVGTSGAVPWYGGEWQAEVFWGRLEESDYFDSESANDHRLFSGVTLGWSPSFVPGLTVGAARTFSTVLFPERYGFADYVVVPFQEVTINESGPLGDDQLLALSMRWHLPSAGFRAWAEWGRADHWDGTDDLLREPDHTQSYTLGVSKLVDLRRGVVRVTAELTDTEKSTTQFSNRATPTTYTNGTVRQGHTHRGQLLGSPLGPGSNAQIIVVDWLSRYGLVGAEIERARYDASAYYPRFADAFGFHGHDIEVTGALRLGHSTETWDVNARVAYSHRENRQFVTLPDLLLTGFDFRFPVDRNWNAGVEVRWKPSLARLFD